ncbi:MAG: PQQ-dependent sugar dehydrogenase [Planctomycetota bacterium]|nr:PQQ-dependent sugar dehydrogenase [Planctomycetota bacterium]MDA1213105.1 PQQ-dependent sugar dehydrogenase [Planctomycetota bacterium]
MSRVYCSLLLMLSLVPFASADDSLKPIVTGLTNPECVCYGWNGTLYVSEIGEFNVDGDGKISLIEEGQAKPFATGLNDPKGLAFLKDTLYVTDKTQVMKIDAEGKASVFVAAEAFPTPPMFLNDIAVDAKSETFLVTDSGDFQGKGGAVYRIDGKTGKVDTVANAETISDLHTPNGIVFDGESFFLVVDMGSGSLYRVKLSDLSAEEIATGFEGTDGMAWDHFGRLYFTKHKVGEVYGMPRPGENAYFIADGLPSAADCCISLDDHAVMIPDMKSGAIYAVPTTIADWEVDDTPLSVNLEVAFPNLKFTGWDDGSESGKVEPLRPILLTHAGDGSNRIFVPEQQGKIHVFENDDAATETKVFLDISEKVRYRDKFNEEGLLGLAFHPNYAENGEFFVFYTDVKAEMENVVSRFRVSADDPNKADAEFEEELLRFERPYWNHAGGTIAFGPDGCLYITHGDGGAANDPHGNGQSLGTWLGKILRIDVDNKDEGKNYAIPDDNPFVGDDDAKPEIWAYGLRNVWRMAFDRDSGQLWAGDVGQNLFEEIIHVYGGGNYGWSIRESLHPFSKDGVDVQDDVIEPIWEYSHDIGKSITGGTVYRGDKVPALQGMYVYADYITMRVWALYYDEDEGRVTENHPITSPGVAALSFGEDEQGEIYLLHASPTGQGIMRFVEKQSE